MTRSILMLAALAACSNEAPLSGHACPCADGYMCCSTDVCVPEGQACTVVDPTTVDRHDLPCTQDDDLGSDGTIDTHWDLTYDNDGNDIHDLGYAPDGSVMQELTSTYDGAHQLLLMIYKQTGAEDQRYSMSYDELERKVIDEEYLGGGDHYREVWTYVDTTATEDVDTDGDDVVDQRTTYVQNAAGKPVSGTIVTIADGSPAGSLAYTYDDAGRLARKDKLAADGSLYDRTDRTYDDAGRILHRTITRLGRLYFEELVTYDGDGRMATYSLQQPPRAPDVSTFGYCH
jgi:hypothetical protein